MLSLYPSIAGYFRLSAFGVVQLLEAIHSRSGVEFGIRGYPFDRVRLDLAPVQYL